MRLHAPIRRRHGDEELTPLINVVFLLLIFVVLAGEVVETAPFAVALPDADNASATSTAMTSIFLGPSGQISVAGEVFSPGDLERALAALPQTKPADMTVEADRAVDASAAFALVEHLQKAGVQRVRLVTSAGGG